jgi:hypothetical protein
VARAHQARRKPAVRNSSEHRAIRRKSMIRRSILALSLARGTIVVPAVSPKNVVKT